MALDAGPIRTENQFPCRTLGACLAMGGQPRGSTSPMHQGSPSSPRLSFSLFSAQRPSGAPKKKNRSTAVDHPPIAVGHRPTAGGFPSEYDRVSISGEPVLVPLGSRSHRGPGRLLILAASSYTGEGFSGWRVFRVLFGGRFVSTTGRDGARCQQPTSRLDASGKNLTQLGNKRSLVRFPTDPSSGARAALTTRLARGRI